MTRHTLSTGHTVSIDLEKLTLCVSIDPGRMTVPVEEIHRVLTSHGLAVDPEHLADVTLYLTLLPDCDVDTQTVAQSAPTEEE